MLKKEGVPFYPKAIDKDLVFSGLVILGILACAAYFGPKGPRGIPNPTYIDTAPAPDFFFLWIYAALALLPPYMETFFCSPRRWLGLGFSLRFLLFPTPGKSARRRPMAVLGVILVFLTLGTLTYLGTFAPWGPTWKPGPAIPRRCSMCTDVRRWSCRARWCCKTSNAGIATAWAASGLRGPALDGVATRLTGDQLIRQVIQGGGNMPAFGKNLAPQEVTALVAFMQTLRPANVPAARDPAAKQ